MVMVLVFFLFDEHLGVQVVEDAGDDTAEGCTTHVHGCVVSQHVFGVGWVQPGLENGATDRQGWVE